MYCLTAAQSVLRVQVRLRVEKAIQGTEEHIQDLNRVSRFPRGPENKGGTSSENTYNGDVKVLRSFYFLLARFREVYPGHTYEVLSRRSFPRAQDCISHSILHQVDKQTIGDCMIEKLV